MLNAAAAAAFLGFLAMAARVRHAERAGAVRHRAAVAAFIAYSLLASFSAGMAQRDLWPFAKWPMAGGLADADAENTRLRAVDARGVEHDVDYRAWQPLAFDDLVPWMHRTFPVLSPPQRARVAAELLRLAEAGRARARAGQPPGASGRMLGPLAAPEFNLHPRRWRSQADVPAHPFVGLRVYRERWNQEELRRDPSRVERVLVFEHRP